MEITLFNVGMKCKCGCGKEVVKKHSWYTPKFIHGHNKARLGTHNSPETCRKLSESHKGLVPWNKGKKGMQTANSGSFYEGQVPWNKDTKGVMVAWNKLPIGGEYISRGRCYIKTKNGWMPRARYVMQELLGRELESWEDVHHIDCDTLNDDPSNLQVMSSSDHMKINGFKKGYTPWNKGSGGDTGE